MHCHSVRRKKIPYQNRILYPEKITFKNDSKIRPSIQETDTVRNAEALETEGKGYALETWTYMTERTLKAANVCINIS